MATTASQLPPEVLAVIFGFADFGYLHPRSFLNLGAVCKVWHTTVFSHPRLWTNLQCLVQNSHSDKSVRRLERWFSYSGDLPLSLTLVMRPHHAPANDVALPPLAHFLLYCPKWKSLHLKLIMKQNPTLDPTKSDSWPWLQSLFRAAKALSDEKQSGCWPLLEELVIEAFNVRASKDLPNVSLISIAPNLQKLSVKFLSSPHARASPDNQFFDMRSLRVLELDFYMNWLIEPTADFFFRVVLQCTRLETLKFLYHCNGMVIPPEETRGSFPSFPVFNPSLQHLTLHDSPGIRWCLTNLSLPSLTSVAFPEPENDLAPPEFHVLSLDLAFQKLALQSECKLTSLQLTNIIVTEAQLSGLLRSIPSLENLDLEFTSSSYLNSEDFLTRLLPPSHDEDLLPALRSFSYTVGAWLTPITVIRLKKLFKMFVEDPRRRSTPPGPAPPSKKYSRLEKAHLFVHRIDKSILAIYARGRRMI